MPNREGIRDSVTISGRVELDFDEHDLLGDVLIHDRNSYVSLLGILSTSVDVSDGDEVEIIINVKRRANQ